MQVLRSSSSGGTEGMPFDDERLLCLAVKPQACEEERMPRGRRAREAGEQESKGV